jgi:hypothetical protein
MEIMSPFRRKLPGGWPEDAPPRSILYSLAPLGCSGEDRESLGSYLNRLCEAHDMTRGTLANTIVGPVAEELLHVSAARMCRDIGRAAYNLNVSSLTEQANQWAQCLNYLTHRENLQLYTLLPLKRLVSSFVLVSEKERFCPACHEEDERRGHERYERLLWCIDAATACPLHRLQLVIRPKVKQPPTPKREDGGFSRETKGRDKIDEAPLHLPASEFEVETSRLIAELLDDVVVFASVGYSASAQSAFLTHAIGLLFNGTSARFAAHLGVSKSQVHGWVKGSVQMSFPRLMQTAYCCGCAIADILLGNRVMLSLRPAPSEQRRRLIKNGVTGARRPKEDLRAELDALIRSGRAVNRISGNFSGNGDGAPGWDRTSNPCLRRAVLYPLSYGRIDTKSAVKPQNRHQIETERIPGFSQPVHRPPGARHGRSSPRPPPQTTDRGKRPLNTPRQPSPPLKPSVYNRQWL